jgi:putative ABC transport system ATP-binding protein
MRKAGMSALESIEAGDLAGKRTGALSGGERQKIAIARGLSGNPEVLFADEPTAHQDDASAARILKVLKACSGRGCIVIVASHDRRVRESGLIDRIHLLDHGRIGTAEWCLTL